MTTLADLARVERELRASNSYMLMASELNDVADTIAAYIKAQGWQPIETAPNDELILVAYDDDSIELVQAEDNDFKWRARRTKNIPGVINPTHWMLVEPPK